MRRGIAVGLLIVAFAALPSVVSGQDVVPVISLDEAIALALQHNPAAVAAGRAVSNARINQTQSRMAWLPSVNVGSAYSNSSNERFDQTTGRLVSENYSAQLSFGYDLFSGGRRLAQQRSAAAAVDAAEARNEARYFETVLGTKRSFYAAAAAAELVTSTATRLERARQQLEFAETRLELGTATLSDVLRADLEVGNAELALLEAESRLHTSRLELGRQVGRAAEVQPTADALPVLAPALPTAEEIGAEAESVSPAAIAAHSDLRARRAGVQAAYGGLLPAVRATGGYDWSSFDFPPSDRSWSLRITASLPLFNGFQREAAIAQARSQEQVARVTARDAALGARVAAQVATREIETAEHRVRLAARAVELAREDLRVQEERYQLGNVTILELQTSQLSLAEAEIAEIQARHMLAIAIGELEAILGRTLEL